MMARRRVPWTLAEAKRRQEYYQKHDRLEDAMAVMYGRSAACAGDKFTAANARKFAHGVVPLDQEIIE